MRYRPLMFAARCGALTSVVEQPVKVTVVVRRQRALGAIQVRYRDVGAGHKTGLKRIKEQGVADFVRVIE